jgi:hypothetical protein
VTAADALANCVHDRREKRTEVSLAYEKKKRVKVNRRNEMEKECIQTNTKLQRQTEIMPYNLFLAIEYSQ